MHPLFVSFGKWVARHAKALVFWTIGVAASIPVAWWMVTKAWPKLQDLARASIGEVGILFVVWLGVILALYVLDHLVFYPLLKDRLRRRAVSALSPGSEERIRELEASNASLQHEQRAYLLWDRYGCRDVSFSELSETTRVALLLNLQEWKRSLREMVRSADVVRVDFWRRFADHPDEFLQDYAKYKYESVYKKTLAVDQRLADQLEVTGGDPRPMLLCFYERYREWRDTTVITAKRAAVSLPTIKGYAEWYERDAQFWKAWEDKLDMKPLAGLRASVLEIENEHGPPKPLPNPSPDKEI